VLPVVLVGVVTTRPAPRPARAATAAESTGRSSRPKKAAPVDLTQSLNAIAEAQRMLAVDLSQLRDQLNDVQDRLGEARDEVRQNRDTLQGALEQIKGMREEVRGLYVESSGLKGDIAQVGKQVDDLGSSLGNFRLSAGIVVAVVLALQVVLVGLMFRGRG
jgi:chromosome segregation ATPase